MNNNDTTQNPRLKAIAEFLDGNHHFIVPSYQRGYRWEERQVIDLLDDISEFQRNIKSKKAKRKDTTGEFYCLQPIVVVDNADKWEIIDGQQRLTTIFILLSYLHDALEVLGLPTSLFSIEYETREKDEYSSKLFLENITKVSEIDKRNIDFYRMSDTYRTIKEWFKLTKVNKGDFCNTLLKTDYNEGVDEANNVRFIWYEHLYGDKPNIVFTKYNRGKIDLTNAELIKALFYLSDNSISDSEKKKYQLKTGYEWDDIENTLRKKDFWNFLNPKKSYTNHIEFIFELIARKYFNSGFIDKTKLKIDPNNDRYWSFYIFNELIVNNKKIYPDSKYDNTKDFLWDEVKTYYRIFVEWYNDNFYFHIIGFLLQINHSIGILKEKAESVSKKQLEKELKELIQKHFGEIDFENTGYEGDRKKAKELLLLFNIVTTMNSDYRFAFDKYSDERWSLEHIHAQQSEELKSDKQRRILLEQQKNYFLNNNNDTNVVSIENLLKEKEIDKTGFDKIQEVFFNEYSNEATVHSIKNLSLLTVSDNSCLSNNIFPIKRDQIKNLDEKGSFIPICTKNVFLKYYSGGVAQNVRWDIQDMDAYLKEMKNVLTDYITYKK
jgi:uncharacterized protein with ParB-like and HNH nuclease domain